MRALTVSTLFRDTAQKGSITGKAKVPHLRLTGRWLERAGFAPGSRVRVVATTAGQLVITTHHE
jgi:hypothetical protein